MKKRYKVLIGFITLFMIGELNAITQIASLVASRSELTTTCNTIAGLGKCNGILTIGIDLMDKSHTPAATDVIVADVELKYGDLAPSPAVGIVTSTHTINLTSVSFTYNPTTTSYEFVFDIFAHYGICGTSNPLPLGIVHDEYVEINATLVSLTGSFVSTWCWDSPTCSQTGNNVAGIATTSGLASPNTPIPQGLLIPSLTITPGIACAPSNYVGFVDFANLTATASDHYHFDVVILEQQGANQVEIGSQRSIFPATFIPAFGRDLVPFIVNLPQRINTNCFLAIKNVEVRTGAAPTDPLVTGLECWRWGSSGDYGPATINYRSTPLPIASKAMAGFCVPLFSSPPSATYSFNGSSNLGTAANPITVCSNTTNLTINKPIDGAVCYGTNYKLRLTTYNFPGSSSSGSSTEELDIFASNTSTVYNKNFNTTGMLNNILATLPPANTNVYYRLELVGYSNASSLPPTLCDDIGEEIFQTIFFVYAPGDQPNVRFKINNKFGQSRATIAAANAQTAALLSPCAGNYTIHAENLNTAGTNIAFLFNSSYEVLLKNSAGTTTHWSSVASTPPFVIPTQAYQFTTSSFCQLAGNCNLPSSTDLFSYIDANPSLYNTDLILEVKTTPNCGTAQSSYMKIRVLDKNYNRNFNIEVRDEVGPNSYVNQDDALPAGNGYNIDRSMNGPFSDRYVIGGYTGNIAMMTATGTTRMDGAIFKMWEVDAGGNETAIYNPNGLVVDLLNNPAAYNPGAGQFTAKFSINEPFTNHTLLDPFANPNHLYWYNLGLPAPVYSNHIDFYTWMTENYGAFGFENQVYKYQLDPISYCNNTVYSSGNTSLTHTANNTGYFWINSPSGTNNIRPKSAGSALYSSISNRGDVKFGLQSNKLYVDLVLPKGGKFSFDVYDIMGRRLDVSSPEQEYKEGRHKMSYDMTQTSTGIYIIHYKINGESLSTKLGMLD